MTPSERRPRDASYSSCLGAGGAGRDWSAPLRSCWVGVRGALLPGTSEKGLLLWMSWGIEEEMNSGIGLGSGVYGSHKTMMMESEYIHLHHNHQPRENQCSSALVKHIKAPVHLVSANALVLPHLFMYSAGCSTSYMHGCCSYSLPPPPTKFCGGFPSGPADFDGIGRC